MTKKNETLISIVIGLVAVGAIVLLMDPGIVLKRECCKVKEVVGCVGDRCRVVLDNGKNAFVYGPTLPNDTVCENLKYKNLYNVVLNGKR